MVYRVSEKLEQVLEIARDLHVTRPLDMPVVFDKMKELLEVANMDATTSVLPRDELFLEVWNIRYAKLRSYLIEMYPQRVIRGQEELIKRITALLELINRYKENN